MMALFSFSHSTALLQCTESRTTWPSKAGPSPPTHLVGNAATAGGGEAVVRMDDSYMAPLLHSIAVPRTEAGIAHAQEHWRAFVCAFPESVVHVIRLLPLGGGRHTRVCRCGKVTMTSIHMVRSYARLGTSRSGVNDSIWGVCAVWCVHAHQLAPVAPSKWSRRWVKYWGSAIGRSLTARGRAQFLLSIIRIRPAAAGQNRSMKIAVVIAGL